MIDVSDRRRADAVLAGEHRVLERVASGAPLHHVLNGLCRLVEEHQPSGLCSVLLLDAAGETVRHAAAPSLPDAYTNAIDGVPIGPKQGSCGTAAFERREVLVTDIETDPLWKD